MSEPLSALTAQLRGADRRAWLVGGAVRDELLGRASLDYDVAVEGDAQQLAKAVGRAAGGHAFLLSEEFGAWRIKGRAADWQLDLTPLTGPTLEADLRNRDLTINAIARALHSQTGFGQADLIDPTGGIGDVEGKRLRAASSSSFSSDPLRVVRLARFTAELADDGFTADPATTVLATTSASQLRGTPAERVFQELRLLLCSQHPTAGLEQLRTTGGMQAVLPELQALRGVEQSNYHHLDVYGHTLLALELAVEIEQRPSQFFPDHASAVTEFLQRPLANEMTRGEALRFGALLHDIAKPQTRAITDEGRITFFHHDVEGAVLSSEILSRLRASEKLSNHVAALTRHHLRLGFLVHKRPLSRRAIYDYMHNCEPVEVDVTLLSVADRFATLGRNHEQAGSLHLDLAQQILTEALAWDADPPKSPLRGDVIASALGIRPGPQLGALLEELAQARYGGEIVTEEETLVYAEDWLTQHPEAPGR